MGGRTKHLASGTYDDEGNYDFRCAEEPPCPYDLSIVDGEVHWHGKAQPGVYHVIDGVPEKRTDRLEPFEEALRGR
jgi:hypothetical protein